MIKEIRNSDEKAAITLNILRDLPEWFGLEDALHNYVAEGKKHPFFVVEHDQKVAGFIYLTKNSDDTLEIYCMGILKEFHRQGMGRMLVNAAKDYARKHAFTYLMVKTVGPSSDDASYAKTRLFYENEGFLALEEIKDLWDPHNPCLIMIQNV